LDRKKKDQTQKIKLHSTLALSRKIPIRPPEECEGLGKKTQRPRKTKQTINIPPTPFGRVIDPWGVMEPHSPIKGTKKRRWNKWKGSS